MITPHGGMLVDRVFPKEKTEEILGDKEYKTILLSPEQISDVKNIARGVYSPLKGFLSKVDFESVLDSMRLQDGTVWPIPIVLDISKEKAHGLKDESCVLLIDEKQNPCALLNVQEIYEYNKNDFAQSVFGTTDSKHPGVSGIYRMEEMCIGGNVDLLDDTEYRFTQYHFTPQETRKMFQGRGWHSVVAFQTRNVPHRGHEFLQREALKETDGLFIQPVVGEKKPDDFDNESIIGSYSVYIDHYLPKEKVVLGVLPLKMRYAGPREAVLHALIRKNFGCTHFIVGRDHAGVSDYYHPFAAHKIFDEFNKGEIGIQILKFPEVVLDGKKKKHCFTGECLKEDTVSFSATHIRDALREKKTVPDYLMRPKVYDYLMQKKRSVFCSDFKEGEANKGFVLWLTGLSQAGKSTISDSVFSELQKKGCLVERLDGDIVRESLTRDLGFSPQDRDENVRRVAFVAKLLSRNGVGVIASFITPYKRQREEIRMMVENYIEVYVNTPLEVCEKRDTKGMYKRAREGEITHFTGISDPFDVPKNPDIEVKTTCTSPDACAEQIVSFLLQKGYVRNTD
ncbi:sulfate adenylyltransferase [Patescibacteria group bacterium]|nr:sulfate adenylyltransferase [Patescibacteria group bacterium]